MMSAGVGDVPVLRFAPSPNGPLHLGHALSALVTFEMARQMGGRFLVRIEDIDTERCRPQFIRAALDDLAWLGLVWEEPVLRQSEHFAMYAEAAGRLREMGLLYPCFATRSEIAAAAVAGRVDPDGAAIYPGLWRGAVGEWIEARFAAGERAAWRLDMARALELVRKMSPGPLAYSAFEPDGSMREFPADPARWGDVVIVRKETPTSYHLSVVVDDARQGITHVTRGLDLLAATDLHRLLQVLLGLPAPVYFHHQLVTDASGAKLSKSAGAPALAGLRQAGWTVDDVRRQLGFSPLR